MRKKTEREENTKEERDKKIMIWTDAKTGVNRRKLNQVRSHTLGINLQKLKLTKFLKEKLIFCSDGKKRVHHRVLVKRDMIERRDPLWVPSFHKTSDVLTFQFFLFVARGSCTADRSLLQPMGSVKSILHLIRPLCSVNPFQELAYRSEIQQIGTVATVGKVTRIAQRRAPQCVKWPETLRNLWA